MRDKLLENYQSRLSILNQLAVNLESETKDALERLPHVDRVYFRVKGAESFVAKARDARNTPSYQDPLVEIEDQVAGRILVFFLSDISVMVSRLQRDFTQVESHRRRPEKDEEFGYESHHLVCVIPPQAKPREWSDFQNLPTTFELQVRTLFMHAWAEPQHGLEYKGAEELPRHIRRELYWVAASSWGADQAFERVLKWQQHRGRSNSTDS